jgi:hypothetical protein
MPVMTFAERKERISATDADHPSPRNQPIRVRKTITRLVSSSKLITRAPASLLLLLDVFL